MIFFRFISLFKKSVACILIISAMPSSAQNDGLINSLLNILWPSPPNLYLFLKEARSLDIPEEYQPPDSEIKKILKKYTTSPIKDRYLGYYKLHNVSVSNSYREAIKWGKIILRVHDDNKVTGWQLPETEVTYRTYSASKDITDAFLGTINNDYSITCNYVTQEGKKPADGYETYKDLKWNDVHNVLKGEWKGGSTKLCPKKQEGIIHIDMHRYPDEFEVKDAIDEFSKDEKKWNETYIQSLLQSGKPLTLDQKKLIITWYIVEAWKAYEDYLPDTLKEKKDDILAFKVVLNPQISSSRNGKKVPMKFGRDPRSLYISTRTFFTDKVKAEEKPEDGKKFKSRLSLIAHEILGHGIFFRYYWPFIEKESKDENTNTRVKEGLAVAVEYAVYQKSGNGNQPSNIEEFAKNRYSGEGGAPYREGVQYLKNKNIITKDGKLDFNQLDKLNNQTNEY